MSRLDILRESLDGGEGFIVSSSANIRYLSDFSGEGTLIITKEEAILVTDFRYFIDAGKCSEFEVRDIADGLEKIMPERLKRAFVEGGDVSYRLFQKYQKQFPMIEFRDCGDKIDKLRQVKSEDEISKISYAASIADNAFSNILNFIRPGVTESDIALELEYLMRKAGAQGVSFDTIAASGENSACPHAVPSKRRLQKGDFLTLDFGCVYEGYCSDMTRTVVIGEVSQKQAEIYEIVLRAQLAGLEAAKPGAVCSEVDRTARGIIKGAGYAKQFGHSLGHSVGLQIHESPSFSPKCGDTLKEGMVITVEPGIYIEGFGGVRIEDLVVIRSSGVQILSKSKKDLLIL